MRIAVAHTEKKVPTPSLRFLSAVYDVNDTHNAFFPPPLRDPPGRDFATTLFRAAHATDKLWETMGDGIEKKMKDGVFVARGKAWESMHTDG